ncbi:hypothetical protein [Microbispora triticiradicis]|uniref:hypothetical protein n=1 Tax=Microbispora triticiradicis TaxID=2200763 RepID=UPI0010590CCF|nr:hypothetical protein [Microbispora triticiradicis]GLW21208.1 hypothetical protein Mame01_12510 [Microbispora amethystogenes]
MRATVRQDTETGGDRTRWSRWRLAALTVPVIITAIVTLMAATPPGGNFPLVLAAIPAWLLSGLVWLGALLFRGYRRSLWVLAPPLAALVAIALVALDVPMKAAFLVSEPALTRYVESVPGEKRWESTRDHVGLFTVSRVLRQDGVTELVMAGSGGFLEECGFAYVPQGGARPPGFSSVDRLTDRWYAVCIDYD